MDFKEKIEGRNRYSFNIKYNGTVENSATHSRFKEFAEKYDGVYISALRVLLDSHEQRKEYDSIIGIIDELDDNVSALTVQVEALKQELENKQEKKVLKTFGKEE